MSDGVAIGLIMIIVGAFLLFFNLKGWRMSMYGIPTTYWMPVVVIGLGIFFCFGGYVPPPSP